MTASPTSRSRIALDLTIAGDRMMLDFSRSAPPCDGPLNIARSTTVACCYVALKHLFTDVPANAGCLAPIEFVIPDTTLLGVSAPRPVGGYTETILRVIDVIFGAFAKAAPERANGSPFAHHQRALARGLARARAALGDVLLLRRRARRQSGGRRAQSRQQPDLDRDHSAAGNPGGALSGDVHPMGAAARLAAGRASIAAGSARSTRSRRWPTAAPRCSCSASAANIRRPASNGGGPAALNRFIYRDRQRRGDAAAGLEGDRRQDQARPEGAAGNAGRRRLRRSARARSLRGSRATCGSVTSRARGAKQDYGYRRRCRRHARQRAA